MTINLKMKSVLSACLLLVLAACTSSVNLTSDGVPRVSKDELRAMLGSKDLVIIDVRTARDWKASRLKIQGAAWEDFQEVETWAAKYPRDKNIVLYCA